MATGQGTPEATGSWKKQAMDLSPELPREPSPADTLISDIQPPEPEEKAAQREKVLDAGGFKEFSAVREAR